MGSCHFEISFSLLFFLTLMSAIHPPPPCFHTATSTKFCPASSRPFFLVCTFVFLATSFSLYSRDWFIKAHGCVLNYCWIWTCQQLCTLFSSKNTCQKHVKLCIRGTYGAFIPYKCCSYVILEYIFFNWNIVQIGTFSTLWLIIHSHKLLCIKCSWLTAFKETQHFRINLFKKEKEKCKETTKVIA